MLLDEIKALLLAIDRDESSDSSPDTIVNNFLALGKWEDIRSCLFEILLRQDQSLWNDVIVYLYYFQNRNFAFEEIKTIGLLCNCQTLCDKLDDNLIWTIIIQLKSLPYLSDYDPFQELQIRNEMNLLNTKRKEIVQLNDETVK